MDGSGPFDSNGSLEMTAAEVVKNFRLVQQEVMRRPVIVTRHGKPGMAILPYTEWRDGKASARRKLLAVIDQLDEAYLGLDGAWQISALNRPAELYFGMPRAQIMGVRLGDAFPAIVGTEAEGYLQRAMEQGEEVNFAWKSVLHPDRKITVCAFPLPRDEGGIGVLFKSVPESEALRAELSLEQKRMAAVLCEIPSVAMIDIDRDGLISGWTGAAEAMLGWSAKEALGQPIESIYTSEAREAGTIWREMAFARRDGRAEMVTTHLSKKGTEVACLSVLVPLHQTNGRFLKILRPKETG